MSENNGETDASVGDLDDLDAQLEGLDLETDFLEAELPDNDDDTVSVKEEEEGEDHYLPPGTEVVFNGDSRNATVQECSEPVSPANRNQEPEWEREEVFSKIYKRSSSEQAALLALEQKLQLKKSKNGTQLFPFRTLSKRTLKKQSLWNTLVDAESERLPQSVLLHQGRVYISQQQQQQDTSQTTNTQRDEEKDTDAKESAPLPNETEWQQRPYHVVLLTRGLLLCTIQDETLDLYRGWAWDRIRTIRKPKQADLELEIVLRTGKKKKDASTTLLRWVCECKTNRDYWWDALQTIVLVYHEHFDTNLPHPFGWQYSLIDTPNFSMAVSDISGHDNVAVDSVNDLDEYNGCSALHYAVHHHHEDAIRALLQGGADPNLRNKDGVSPATMAIRQELPASTLQLLKDFGGKVKKPSKQELFDKVQEAQQVVDQNRQQQAAEVAQAEMNKNMKLLQQRGEQINEISDKAKDLNRNAQDYASMAKQLKAKTKNKSSWFGF